MAEKNIHPQLQLLSGVALIIGASILIAAAAITNDWFSPVPPTSQRKLTQPLRLVVESDNGYREFMIALRVNHYRAQLQSNAEYHDIFYDTEKWDLFRNGYSYRFRMRPASDDRSRYSIRLEQEPRFVPNGSTKVDLSSNLPTSLGDKIASGDWERAVSTGSELAAPKRLNEILAKLDIKPEQLQPRLVAQIHRSRFDVTDKGRNWFELDHEVWTFHEFGESGGDGENYEDIVVDTRLKSNDPELLRRVKTMRELAKMVSGVHPTIHPPHERAIQDLIGS